MEYSHEDFTNIEMIFRKLKECIKVVKIKNSNNIMNVLKRKTPR